MQDPETRNPSLAAAETLEIGPWRVSSLIRYSLQNTQYISYGTSPWMVLYFIPANSNTDDQIRQGFLEPHMPLRWLILLPLASS